jgi:hypothetical protein
MTLKNQYQKIAEYLGNYDGVMIVKAENYWSKVYGRIHFPNFTSRKKYLSILEPHEKRFELY